MEEASEKSQQEFDYSFVPNTARVAIYDDMLSSPQIVDIQPTTTREFISELATTVYDRARGQGGNLPFSIILQVAENFIHAKFTEIVVSVLDGGNTIRFADQGPGISDKDKAQRPGYSSATSAMKDYINGVGSGLPIVREYLETKHGAISIEDNLDNGAVVTISLSGGIDIHDEDFQGAEGLSSYIPPRKATSQKRQDIGRTATGFNISHLSKDEIKILRLFLIDDVWGVKNIASEIEIPVSTAHSKLCKLLEAGIMSRLGTKWILSDFGTQVVSKLM